MKILKKKKINKKINKFMKRSRIDKVINKHLKGDSKLLLDKNQVIKQKQVTELNWDGE
jgi:hypothetical protein